jgi:hypothetical protein
MEMVSIPALRFAACKNVDPFGVFFHFGENHSTITERISELFL